jgi:hypothetical protein
MLSQHCEGRRHMSDENNACGCDQSGGGCSWLMPSHLARTDGESYGGRAVVFQWGNKRSGIQDEWVLITTLPILCRGKWEGGEAVACMLHPWPKYPPRGVCSDADW